jgi:tRNA(Ile)-lysidine synthase
MLQFYIEYMGLTFRVGLAVSGGVDSMALATLYSKALKSPTGLSLPQCHGIIIDHKFRPESTEEAKWVSEQLKSKRERTLYSC